MSPVHASWYESFGFFWCVLCVGDNSQWKWRLGTEVCPSWRKLRLRAPLILKLLSWNAQAKPCPQAGYSRAPTANLICERSSLQCWEMTAWYEGKGRLSKELQLFGGQPSLTAGKENSNSCSYCTLLDMKRIQVESDLPFQESCSLPGISLKAPFLLSQKIPAPQHSKPLQ